MTKLILYADDDADDKAWITEACQTISVPFKLDFVENGKEVFRYLSLLSGDQLPSLIVLDLNMPELDGKQTLQQLKITPGYEKIPVAIVSTSSNKIDRDVCQRLGASVFLVKPSSQSGWQDIIHHLAPLIAY